MGRLSHYTVFFDFDNTITAFDVIDDLVLRFSQDKRWMILEEEWKKGRIGSRQCLEGQLAGVRISKRDLDNYLKGIRLDSCFKKLLRLLDSGGAKTLVLSDNFDYALKNVLKNNRVRNLKIYANRVRLDKDRLRLSFPFSNKKCGNCAHCKKSSLLANLNGGLSVYIGDGLSDVCAAKQVDLVFAKGSLRRYFKKHNLAHLPYKTLRDVYAYFKEGLA